MFSGKFRSFVGLLCSVFNNKVEIIESLAKKDKSNKVDCIDWALVQLLINFLQVFNAATKEFEGDSYPTIQEVFQCHHMLNNYMKISPSDSSMLQFLEKKELQCLKEKFVMSDIRLLGLFFHPKFKLLVPLTLKEQKNVHLHARTLLSVASASSTVTNKSESYAGPSNSRLTYCGTATDHSYITPPKKSTKFSWLENEFQHWQDDFCSLKQIVMRLVLTLQAVLNLLLMRFLIYFMMAEV